MDRCGESVIGYVLTTLWQTELQGMQVVCPAAHCFSNPLWTIHVHLFGILWDMSHLNQ